MAVMIMRGIPGSGKSTEAQRIAETTGAPNSCVISADAFFIGDDGVYRFEPSRIGEAHAQCFRNFLTEIQRWRNESMTVVVDNTNTCCWEASPYVLAAQAFGHAVQIVHVVCDVEVAAARNTHGVPAATVRSMADRFEQSLPFWSEQVVYGTGTDAWLADRR